MEFYVSDKPEEQGLGGFDNPAVGRYHVAVKEVGSKNEKGSTPVTMYVLTGNVPGQEGKEFREFLKPDPSKPFSMERIGRLLWAAGLLAPGERRHVEFSELESCQLLVQLGERKYKDANGREQTSVNIDAGADGGCWPIGHPDAKDIPIAQDSLRYRRPGTAREGQGTAGGHAAQQPATQGGPAAAGQTPVQQAFGGLNLGD